MNSVKVFVKDYGNLLKHEAQFYKRHWKGTLITNVIIFGGVAAAGAVYTVNQEKKYEKQKRYEEKKAKKKDDIKVEYTVETE